MIDLANELRAETTQAAARLRRLGEADVTRERGAGKWVKKEILGHLIDSAANNHQRFVRAQLTRSFVWPGYDQEVWVPLHHYRDRAWTELVDLWVSLNKHVASVIEHVPGAALATPCTIGDNAGHDLEWWMRDYLRHLKHHLSQLDAE
jgi:hypothetical protein